jgi:hypothetical protein
MIGTNKTVLWLALADACPAALHNQTPHCMHPRWTGTGTGAPFWATVEHWWAWHIANWWSSSTHVWTSETWWPVLVACITIVLMRACVLSPDVAFSPHFFKTLEGGLGASFALVGTFVIGSTYYNSTATCAAIVEVFRVAHTILPVTTLLDVYPILLLCRFVFGIGSLLTAGRSLLLVVAWDAFLQVGPQTPAHSAAAMLLGHHASATVLDTSLAWWVFACRQTKEKRLGSGVWNSLVRGTQWTSLICSWCFLGGLFGLHGAGAVRMWTHGIGVQERFSLPSIVFLWINVVTWISRVWAWILNASIA